MERRTEDVQAVELCPMCDGKMEIVYNRNAQQVLVCGDCHTGVTVPSGAWEIARIKREAKKSYAGCLVVFGGLLREKRHAICQPT